MLGLRKTKNYLTLFHSIDSDRVKKDENYLTLKHNFAGAYMTGDLQQRQLINSFGTEFTCLKGSWLT